MSKPIYHNDCGREGGKLRANGVENMAMRGLGGIEGPPTGKGGPLLANNKTRDIGTDRAV